MVAKQRLRNGNHFDTSWEQLSLPDLVTPKMVLVVLCQVVAWSPGLVSWESFLLGLAPISGVLDLCPEPMSQVFFLLALGLISGVSWTCLLGLLGCLFCLL